MDDGGVQYWQPKVIIMIISAQKGASSLKSGASDEPIDAVVFVSLDWRLPSNDNSDTRHSGIEFFTPSFSHSFIANSPATPTRVPFFRYWNTDSPLLPNIEQRTQAVFFLSPNPDEHGTENDTMLSPFWRNRCSASFPRWPVKIRWFILHSFSR